MWTKQATLHSSKTFKFFLEPSALYHQFSSRLMTDLIIGDPLDDPTGLSLLAIAYVGLRKVIFPVWADTDSVEASMLKLHDIL